MESILWRHFQCDPQYQLSASAFLTIYWGGSFEEYLVTCISVSAVSVNISIFKLFFYLRTLLLNNVAGGE